MSLSIPVAVITIANLIKEKINKGKSIIYVILTTIAVWALSLIPYAGGVISFIVTLAGFGLLITSLFNVFYCILTNIKSYFANIIVIISVQADLENIGSLVPNC